MLDSLVPVDWRRSRSGLVEIAEAFAPLPREVATLRQPAFTQSLCHRILCPCCAGEAVVIRAGLVYLDAAIVFLDSRVTCCLSTHRFVLSAADRAELLQRSEVLSGEAPGPCLPRRAGIGSILALPYLSDPLAARLSMARSADARFFRSARVIRSVPARPWHPTTPPDALAFHSTRFPDQITLKLEPTTRCNFRCGFCYGRHLKQGSLTYEAFERILSRLPGLRAVELTGEGEPLVNPSLFAMLAECTRRGLWCHVTTNGSLLNEERLERLLAVGLRSIAVSLESIDPLRFSRLRPGSDLGTVLKAIRTIDAVRRRLRTAVESRLWVTLLRDTLPELGAIARFVEEAGVDYLEFQALNAMPAYTSFYDAELRANVPTFEELRSRSARGDLPSRALAALDAAIEEYRGATCDVFTTTLMVNWQGFVTPCCRLKFPHFAAAGNLLEELVGSVWEAESFRLFRFCLQHGLVLRSCDGCPSVAAKGIGLSPSFPPSTGRHGVAPGCTPARRYTT